MTDRSTKWARIEKIFLCAKKANRFTRYLRNESNTKPNAVDFNGMRSKTRSAPIGVISASGARAGGAVRGIRAIFLYGYLESKLY